MTDPMKTASERLDELLGPEGGSMTHFPADIVQAAITAWNESTRISIRRVGHPWEPIARAIIAERAKAEEYKEYAEFWQDMLATPIAIIEGRAEKRGAEQERERCARVAESFAAPQGSVEIDYDEACRDIAAAIRGGGHDS